jgi:predicted RecA/RadA family phage recombinase
MKNFVQPGDLVTVAAPTGGIASGQGVLIGALFGVAAITQAEGSDVEIATRGVFDLAKMNGAEFTPGAAVYWDAATKTAAAGISTAGGDARIGVALEVAGPSAATVRCRLDGVVIN